MATSALCSQINKASFEFDLLVDEIQLRMVNMYGFQVIACTL